MKVRTGFVSNSSSTSFTIYGGCYNPSEIKKWLEKSVELTEEDKEELSGSSGYGVYEVLSYNKNVEELLPTLEVEHGYDCEYIYLGLSPQKFPDDKTVGETKKMIFETLNKCFPGTTQKDMMWHEECYRDG